MEGLDVDEAIKEYEALVSFIRIPDYSLKDEASSAQEREETKAKNQSGIMILSNTTDARELGNYGTTITEHWMLFPEHVETAIEKAIETVLDTDVVVSFELHTFKELKATVRFPSVQMREELIAAFQNEDLKRAIDQELVDISYDAEIGLRIL
uniref:Uncharacterized protein n=1 Tax=Ciona savignyi TaxID=51511 RepID=H2YKC4_CIOSA